MKKNNSFIHWYPGHIAKAERQLKEVLNLVDVVIEVRDARLPMSSGYNDIKKLLGNKPRLLLLNKSDLVNNIDLDKWINKLNTIYQIPTLKFIAKGSFNIDNIIKQAIELSEDKIQSLMAKGLLRRPARAIVVGMPNVGKSSIINTLTKSTKTKTGAKAGVTRQQQWVRINPKLELLDTAGIIPTKQENQLQAAKLAIVNSISENAYSAEDVAKIFLEISLQNKLYTDMIKTYYKLDDNVEITIDSIAKQRNWIKKNNEPDIERTASNILKDYRNGKIGPIILDLLDDN